MSGQSGLIRAAKRLLGAPSDGDVIAYDAATDALEFAAGGAGAAGAARVLGPFPFAFDDVGLEDGIAFYTPTVDDILLDGWIELTELFDGTTPLGDFGQTDVYGAGIFSNAWGQAVNVAGADSAGSGPAPTLASIQSINLLTQGSLFAVAGAALAGTYVGGLGGPRGHALRVLTDDPFKIVVSQDGTVGGGAVGGTAGAGAVYLVVATPSLEA